jgi:hypothetical protein
LQQWRISMHPCWRVWQELEYCSMCAVSPMVHTSNVSSCQEVFLWLWTILGRSFDFLVINVCNHGEHYETACINA